MKVLAKIFCFIFGHSNDVSAKDSNERTKWVEYTCNRCGKLTSYQWS